MRRLLIFILLLLVCLPTAAYGYQQLYYVKIEELYANPHRYNNSVVGIKGEVVGDIIRAQNSIWINVNDDPYAIESVAEGSPPRGQNTGIGVVITPEMEPQIKHLGSYHEKGDYVEIIGEFHESCPEHGGEADIHAYELRVVREGYPIEHDLNLPLAVVALALTVVAAGGFLLRYYFITRPGFRRRQL